MPRGVPPFAIYDPGADSTLNEGRRIDVRAVTVHTTEGNDSRGLGKTRHHNSPGTFNFLVRDEGVYCYYPADVKCSHAAGGNYAGPGIENEGFTGRPFSPAKLANFGRLAHWLAETYGVPLAYKSGDPRIWLDRDGYHGFIAHRAITYPPNTSFNHYDLLTPDEFSRALGQYQPGDPQTIPPPTERQRIMQAAFINGHHQVFYVPDSGDYKKAGLHFYDNGKGSTGRNVLVPKGYCASGDREQVAVSVAPDGVGFMAFFLADPGHHVHTYRWDGKKGHRGHDDIAAVAG